VKHPAVAFAWDYDLTQRVPVHSMEGLSRMEVRGERFRERVARKNVNRGKSRTFQAEAVEMYHVHA
jgi:hypothetical protein